MNDATLELTQLARLKQEVIAAKEAKDVALKTEAEANKLVKEAISACMELAAEL